MHMYKPQNYNSVSPYLIVNGAEATMVMVSFDPFEPLSPAEMEAAVAAAEAYGRFLELPVEIGR
jgi:hypothetical protein